MGVFARASWLGWSIAGAGACAANSCQLTYCSFTVCLSVRLTVVSSALPIIFFLSPGSSHLPHPREVTSHLPSEPCGLLGRFYSSPSYVHLVVASICNNSVYGSQSGFSISVRRVPVFLHHLLQSILSLCIVCQFSQKPFDHSMSVYITASPDSPFCCVDLRLNPLFWDLFCVKFLRSVLTFTDCYDSLQPLLVYMKFLLLKEASLNSDRDRAESVLGLWYLCHCNVTSSDP